MNFGRQLVAGEYMPLDSDWNFEPGERGNNTNAQSACPEIRAHRKTTRFPRKTTSFALGTYTPDDLPALKYRRTVLRRGVSLGVQVPDSGSLPRSK